jgi:hypothetical protein
VRHDLGVSKSLWGEACVTMGRDLAAVALMLGKQANGTANGSENADQG